MASGLRRALGLKPATSPWADTNAIRSMLFSVERLEEHARSLAASQGVSPQKPQGHRLLARLTDNEASLIGAYQSICGAVSEGAAITPAAEWLIDNFHQVERQIRQVRSDLPPRYYRELPRLAHGPFAGLPRVFEIAWAFVAHTDSHFDVDVWTSFVRAYQKVQPLTIGELWASAITLRIILVENLRRIAERIVDSRDDRRRADELANRLLGSGGEAAEPGKAILAELDKGRLSDAFLLQLVYRLRDQGPTVAPLLAHLDERLAVEGKTVDAAVNDEQQKQVSANVTVRNIITSMRRMSDVDWTEIFEHVSVVDTVLADGCGFAEMDFPTRNLYRTAVEELARGSGLSELEVARRAVLAGAQAAPDAPEGEARLADPGYYLCAGGRVEFEAAIGFRPRLQVVFGRFYRALGIGGYIGAGALVAALLLALPILFHAQARPSWIWLGLLGTLGAIPALDAAVALVNQGLTHRFGATLLPALELREGVPKHLRTLVVMPTLLTTPESVAAQVANLEIHHLASRAGDVQFALLSDWTDAATEEVEGDQALLRIAVDGIAQLNQRHGPAPGGDRFLLLHRRRVWNESQRRWIGWERKRGKLHELNRWLRGNADTTFVGVAGRPPRAPQGVRYVVTLDADTRLRRDSLRRLIGKMAHPLNQPRFDPVAGRVVEGHAVLQPRITTALPTGAEGSVYQRVFSSMSGIDPYSAAISDVYQDLFEEGSYAGKGIYAVDAFEAALKGRTPDSTLLSHDLFEGVFARAGLVSDVEAVEAYPARYDVAALRYHRWARGDWQLLPWILGWSGLLGKTATRSAAMPASGRWKMIDNLRRTLSPMTCLLALLAGWLLPLDAAIAWTLFVLGTIVLPSFAPALAGIPPRHAGLSLRSHFRAVASDFRLAFLQSLLITAFLAHQAWLMGDAILRTLFRLFISRRNLLEWTPAAQATIGRSPTTLTYYRWMAGAVLTGLAAPVAAWISGDRTWLLAVPFSVLWIASPAIARWVSRPSIEGARPAPSAADARALRLIARRTWRFFETFVTAEDHMLPPDNFQDDPAPVVAHRTSPTNIGLYLLSTASAHDFGWLGLADTVARLEATLATMGSLPRFRGHLYNWYDTRDLRPLDPQYVSSVDSGNLAGHLIALANACEEWRDLAAAARLQGINDALDLMAEELDLLRDRRHMETVTLRQLDDALAALVAEAHQPLGPSYEITDQLASLATTADTLVDVTSAFTLERGDGASSDLLFWARAARASIASHQRDLASSGSAAETLSSRLSAVATTARDFAVAMDFEFLLDPQRMLLSIGFLVPEGTLDESCYDLLASEARLASYVGVAKGDLPTRHWFRLGHDVTPVDSSAALISWSGSMFEYLMPSLVMRTPIGSVLEHTNRVIVQRQIEYGKTLGTPWGVSESAYNTRDLELTYQYSNFGVPGLGLKRGLGDNAVVAPYATALAATVDPTAAARNFEQLVAEGGRARYGFVEALDYTAPRVPQGQTVAVVRAFMAHHQGMTIVAIADALLEGAMRRRFHAEPMMRSAELLLQERMPREIAVQPPWASDATSAVRVREWDTPDASRSVDPYAATPATHLLSNDRYSVMLTAAGAGYSRWGDLAVTRWREDATCDDWGSFIYFRDVESDAVWSAGVAPCGLAPDHYAVTFSADRASFSRRDGELNTLLDVVVSAEDDAEVRRVTITNTGKRARDLEVTSYAEVVIAPQASDVAHPAFSKMFVQTEYVADLEAILATRRRRAPDEPEVWAAHHSVAEGEGVGKPEFESSRARFLGRGRSVRSPAAVIDGRLLSGSTGSVLDPVFALRRRVRLAPGATVRIAFWTMVSDSRSGVLDLVDKTNDVSAFDRATTLAWTKAQVRLHHLGIGRGEANLFQRLAGRLLYATPGTRSSSEAILRGAGPQPGLWLQGISGDLPILLLRIANAEDVRIAHQLLRAMEYWRDQRLAVDLVIINERASSYVQDLQVTLEALVRASLARPSSASPAAQAGGVFVLRADLIPPQSRALLESVARVVLVAEQGGLAEQLDHAAQAGDVASPVRKPRAKRAPQAMAAPRPQLEYFNGLGGFSDDGKEYVTILGPGQSTPAPWINVVANPGLGFQTSAEGSGFTWSVNSREHQLTPWSNDPVTDPPGEALYLRDEETDDLWSPTAAPIRDQASAYVARHGFGYSRFEHEAHGVASDLLVYVPLADPIKISRLRLRNTTRRRRRVSVTAYAEWVLGVSRAASAPFVVTELDAETGALFARNAWNPAFGPRVAFLDLVGRQTSWTGDRREFIGRNGVLGDPAGLAAGARLSGSVGGGLDPCGVLQTVVDLAPGGEAEIVILLGDAADRTQAADLIGRYREADLDAILNEVRGYWGDVLGSIQVKTPDRSMDIMLNGWLLYQTLACRLWARSGFYQASGAYGFRDQLQDGMALAAIRPLLTREHLIRAAGRQFAEGDVQHWWLPHSGQGVRTRISDDKAWLAFAVAHYIEVSGDIGVLEEVIPFLDAPTLTADQHESFSTPAISKRTATLYEHCALALEASLAVGRHGLPLMGGGDWNDGMNRVGEGGQGESVWLAWLLYATLADFARLADTRNDAARAGAWREHAAALGDSLEREAWDGDWYRRAWFDDGAVIGSAANAECRIDSIAQSWAVISGAAKPKRAAHAMTAVERELIDEDNGLALLFTPPFDRTPHDPGYIKGYPPGLRENGGQYTHAAVWSVIAFAKLGEGDTAAGLFARLNPINHARTRAELRRYKVEPYVVAADIYAAPDQLGHGGWTWYTGSAGWMYRAGVESILGLRFEGSRLCLDPCIPKSWPGFEITLRRQSARLHIAVDNPAGVSRGVASAHLDGAPLAPRPLELELPDDDQDHELRVTLG
jgi:cyclic beta-1,2-glucan synthetase